MTVAPVAFGAATVQLKPLQVSEGTLKVLLPGKDVIGLAAYDVSVDGSAKFRVNAPDLWWVMGDGGNFATAQES